MPLVAIAQRNPVTGYVITATNDTIYGTIDYLTPRENCTFCSFKADGEDTFRDYSPQDIAGYRFYNDSVYYVSQAIHIDGQMKQVFTEFLLKGGVSLYRYTNLNDTYYIFREGEKVIVLRDDDLKTNSVEYSQLKKQRMNDYRQLYAIFSKDPETADKIYSTPYKAEKLTPIIRHYDEEFCQEAGECIQFQYDKKKSRFVTQRFMIDTGVVFGRFPGNTVETIDHHNIVTPKVSVGLALHSDRFSPSVDYIFKIGFLYWEKSGISPRHTERVNDTMYLIYPETEWKDNNFVCDLSVGVSYHFLRKKPHQPFISAGIEGVYFVPAGFYANVGYDFAIKKHRLQLFAQYDMYKCNMMGKYTFCYAGLCFIL